MLESLIRNADSVLLIEADSNREYRYKEIRTLVNQLIIQIEKSSSEINLLVISADNSVSFIIAFLASIFSTKKVLLVNPFEDEESVNEKAKIVSESYLILTSQRDHKFLNETIYIDNKLVHYEDLISWDISDFTVYVPTSSTTGQSKIVKQQSDQIWSNLNAVIEHHNINQDSIMGTPLPLFHVNALYLCFLPSLLVGAKFVIQKSFDLKLLLNSIEKYKIQKLSLVPVILDSMVRNHELSKHSNLESLEYIISAAAPLSVNTIKEIKKYYSVKIVQGYGLSEGINFSCTLPINLSENEYTFLMTESTIPSVGLALKDNIVRVIKDDLSITGPGEIGEIVIKGKNIFSGYENMDNTNFFIDGFFRTGDLGFYKLLNNKQFFYISGRSKEVAKIYGESVALRDYDELLKDKVSFNCDFFTTSFENDFKGEELAIVVDYKNNNIDDFFSFLSGSILKLDLRHKPKVVLFVRDEPIRTASGKALRFKFKKYFTEYKEMRLLNKVIMKSI